MYKYKTNCIKQFTNLLTSLKEREYWYHYILCWPNRKKWVFSEWESIYNTVFIGISHLCAVYLMEICICCISIAVSSKWFCSSYDITYCDFLWLQCSEFRASMYGWCMQEWCNVLWFLRYLEVGRVQHRLRMFLCDWHTDIIVQPVVLLFFPSF